MALPLKDDKVEKVEEGMIKIVLPLLQLPLQLSFYLLLHYCFCHPLKL